MSVWAIDEKPPAQLEQAISAVRGLGVTFITPQEFDPSALGLTLAVLSPGVPLTSPLVSRVQEAGVPVYSEIEVAYRLCRAPIVAVTGTKGKTTTTSLIGALFRAAGKTTHVGGNIGNALIGEVEAAGPNDWVIAEVSSFQLESIRAFKPRISLITNLSPDHLDRYHSMEEYTEAKFRIFANQGSGDCFIGNLDDPLVSALSGPDGSKRIHCRALWFARTEASSAGGKRPSLYLRNERIVYAPPVGDPRTVEIMPVSEIHLLGSHNVENVLAALLAGLTAGLDPEALRAGVRGFASLPHRLQVVGERGGILYVNDSKATNPSSVVAALEAFSRPIVLIAGGKSKRTDFSALGNAVVGRARAVVLIGEAAEEIAEALDSVKSLRANSMKEALRVARSCAKPGDVVLLSPGCASFDMFTSAEARGEAFTAAFDDLESK
jgi:UDP-N-acetylmuramoylalanine--D-glutamate ligase